MIKIKIQYKSLLVDLCIPNTVLFHKKSYYYQLKTSKIPYIDMNEARCFYVNIDLENMPRKGKQWNSFV